MYSSRFVRVCGNVIFAAKIHFSLRSSDLAEHPAGARRAEGNGLAEGGEDREQPGEEEEDADEHPVPDREGPELDQTPVRQLRVARLKRQQFLVTVKSRRNCTK